MAIRSQPVHARRVAVRRAAVFPRPRRRPVVPARRRAPAHMKVCRAPKGRDVSRGWVQQCRHCGSMHRTKREQASTDSRPVWRFPCHDGSRLVRRRGSVSRNRSEHCVQRCSAEIDLSMALGAHVVYQAAPPTEGLRKKEWRRSAFGAGERVWVARPNACPSARLARLEGESRTWLQTEDY